jgi:hypothetical protein
LVPDAASSTPVLSWQKLSRSIELEFRPSEFKRPRASLSKLQQTGSLDDYYLEFTTLANRSTGLTPEALLDCFVSGLQKELQRDTLLQAVAIARLFEDKYHAAPKPSQFTHPHQIHHPCFFFHYTLPKKPPLLPTPNTKPLPFPNRTIKQISLTEMQLRIEKGKHSEL